MHWIRKLYIAHTKLHGKYTPLTSPFEFSSPNIGSSQQQQRFTIATTRNQAITLKHQRVHLHPKTGTPQIHIYANTSVQIHKIYDCIYQRYSYISICIYLCKNLYIYDCTHLRCSHISICIYLCKNVYIHDCIQLQYSHISICVHIYAKIYT